MKCAACDYNETVGIYNLENAPWGRMEFLYHVHKKRKKNECKRKNN